MFIKQLKRMANKELNYLGGVCSGFAYLTKTPAWFVRILTLIFLCVFPFLIVLYVALWILLPKIDISTEEFNAVTLNKDF